MKTLRSRILILSAIAVAAFVLVLISGTRSPRPQPMTRSAPEAQSPALSQPGRSATNKSFHTRGAELSQAQKRQLLAVFDKRLKPAFDAWCKAYEGRIPFVPEHLTADKFLEEMGRGTFCQYVFMVGGVTLGIADINGVAKVSYLNSPAAKKLMELPGGQRMDVSSPVTREDLGKMLLLDAGTSFPASEIRMVPTAFSSAMGGGTQVQVGGEPENVASWKFTLVFGKDGKLHYYFRGNQ